MHAFIILITYMQGMPVCGTAISSATVEACLNTSFCVNSSGSFNTLSDGKRMTNISFTELIENRNYSHSTIYLFLNEKMVMTQQVTICKLLKVSIFDTSCIYSSL